MGINRLLPNLTVLFGGKDLGGITIPLCGVERSFFKISDSGDDQNPPQASSDSLI